MTAFASSHRHPAWRVAAAALFVLSGLGPPSQAAGDEDRFSQALAEYERCHWPQAYVALGTLADEGHPQAARLALQMARHGDRLFGMHFELAADRQARWLALASTDLAQLAQR